MKSIFYNRSYGNYTLARYWKTYLFSMFPCLYFAADCAYSREELERQHVPLDGGHFTGFYCDGNSVDHPGDCHCLHRLEGEICCLLWPFRIMLYFRLQLPPFLDFLVTWTSLSNSLWNPFMYWLLNSDFRRLSRSLMPNKVCLKSIYFCFILAWLSDKWPLPYDTSPLWRWLIITSPSSSLPPVPSAHFWS